METFQPEEDIRDVFEKGVSLNETAKSLWMIYIKYIILHYDDEYIEHVYKRAMQLHADIKPHYLQWLHAAKGIEETRRQYDALVTERPFNKEFHREMLKLETVQLRSDIERWELVYKCAIEQFPSDRHMRYNYLKFLKHTKNCDDVKEEYEKALNDLTDTEKPLFQTECNELFYGILFV